MVVEFCIRENERNDVRAMAIVKTALSRNGLKIDRSRKVTCHRNGGLWNYVIPVFQEVDA